LRFACKQKTANSVWRDVDEYAYTGFALDDETAVTGLKIEHFNKWQLAADTP